MDLPVFDHRAHRAGRNPSGLGNEEAILMMVVLHLTWGAGSHSALINYGNSANSNPKPGRNRGVGEPCLRHSQGHPHRHAVHQPRGPLPARPRTYWTPPIRHVLPHRYLQSCSA